MSERGDTEGAQRTLDSMTLEGLQGAFVALAGGYAGLSNMMGVDLAGMDKPEVVDFFVDRAEFAERVLRGRMGYN